MKMYKDYDSFTLAKPLQDTTIPVGSNGVVLMVLDSIQGIYEVEFPDGNGGNLGKDVTYTITSKYMKTKSNS